MATMIAYVLTGHGGPEKLEYREAFPRPVAGPGEVLVRVRACGCNNTDINTRIGWYSKAVTAGTTETQGGADVEADGSWGGHLTFPRVQGADICGEVAEVGDGVEEALVGKRVLVDTWVRDPAEPTNMRKMRFVGSELDGGFAQFAKVPRRQIHVVDSEQLTDAELATFATAYTTAENMLNRAKVTAGDVVLIPGASGGVGSALIQLANRRKATTVAMCSESKRAAVEAVGPTAVLPREPADVAAALKAAVGRDTVDVLADVVGGPAWPKLLDVVERGGRFTCAGAIAGPIVDFDLRTFYLKDLTFVGATCVPDGTFADLVGYIEKGEVKPLLAATFPLEDLPKAQETFVAKKFVGNIVIVMP